MGFYINPPDCSKEEFLAKHGTKVTARDMAGHSFSSDTLPVCLIDNGAFTAAGIAYSPRELNAFLQPDRRPRTWYTVPKALLEPYLGGQTE